MKKIFVFFMLTLAIFGGEILISKKGIEYRYIKNENSDKTIVIFTGASVIIDWNTWIQDELSKKYNVLLYNRGGYGNSYMNEEERRVEVIVDEAEELLDELGINKNIILLGPSLGGIYSRYFLYENKDKVIALVTIDTPISNMYNKIEGKLPENVKEMVKTTLETRGKINNVVDSELDYAHLIEMSDYTLYNKPALFFYNTNIGTENQSIMDLILSVAVEEAEKEGEIEIIYSNKGHDIITNDKEMFFKELYRFLELL